MKRITALFVSIVFVLSAFFSVGAVTLNAAEYTEAPAITEHQVLKKIDTLAKLLDGKYFTTTGSSCWNNCCSKCYNANVFKSKWFKNLFGNVSVDQIPGQAYPFGNTGYASGWSCHGFANFAMWYIFASDNSDRVDYKRVADYITLTEENIKKYARPGDIIRYKKGDSGHSAIFVSADEDGIIVLDNNYKLNYSDGYNRIRLHKMKYNGYSMAISRATNYIDTPSLTVNFNANGGTVLNSTLKGYAYEVVSARGLNLRSGTSTSYKLLTVIPEGTIFTVELNKTIKMNGYTWGKTTYGKYTGWVVISESRYTSKLGEVMDTPFFVKGGMVYSSATAEAFSQKFLYDETKIGLVDAAALGIVNGDNKFIGWSTTSDGKNLIRRGASLYPDDIAKCVNNKDNTVTLYAVWESQHTHSYSEWSYNGNEHSHSAICSCGHAVVQNHEWIEDQSVTEEQKVYRCKGCGINKTVFLASGIYSMGGVFFSIGDMEASNGWLLINGNKIITYNSIWRNNF